MSSDMGGTMIITPIKDLNSQQSKLKRSVFLLTDGAVSNMDEIVEEIKKNSSNTHYYTLGIGKGAS